MNILKSIKKRVTGSKAKRDKEEKEKALQEAKNALARLEAITSEEAAKHAWIYHSLTNYEWTKEVSELDEAERYAEELNSFEHINDICKCIAKLYYYLNYCVQSL